MGTPARKDDDEEENPLVRIEEISQEGEVSVARSAAQSRQSKRGTETPLKEDSLDNFYKDLELQLAAELENQPIEENFLKTEPDAIEEIGS